MDFLNCGGELSGFDVCIDKGTFDAISLNPDDNKECKKLYVQTLKCALKDSGIFAITSCNWTKDQLLERFCEGERKLIISDLKLCFLSVVGFVLIYSILDLNRGIVDCKTVYISISHHSQKYWWILCDCRECMWCGRKIKPWLRIVRNKNLRSVACTAISESILWGNSLW